MYLHLLFDLLYLEHQSWSNSHSFDELVVWASHCHFETKERKCKKFLPSLNNTQILFGKFFPSRVSCWLVPSNLESNNPGTLDLTQSNSVVIARYSDWSTYYFYSSICGRKISKIFQSLCHLYQEVPNIQVNMYFVKLYIFFSKKRVRSNAKLRENVLVPPNY